MRQYRALRTSISESRSKNVAHLGIYSIGPLAKGLQNNIIAVVDNERIVAKPTGHCVNVATAIDDIVAFAAIERIETISAVDRVVAIATVDDIGAAIAGQNIIKGAAIEVLKP